jgi:Tol biopolymer transport system component
VAYLVAEVGDSSDRPRSEEVPLPIEAGPNAAVSVTLTLPTLASWPEEFTIRAIVKQATGTEEPVEVASAVFRPGRIALIPVWPEYGYLDFPLDDSFVIRLDTAVSLDSLRACVSLRTAAGDGDGALVPLDVAAVPDLGPLTYEVLPLVDLEPFTRYSLLVGRALVSEDGQTRMGRDRAVVFSTGPSRSFGSTLWPPAWSPTGERLAWVAPGTTGALTLFVGDLRTMTATAMVERVLGGTPAWAGDGRHILYAVADPAGAGVGRLDVETGSFDVMVRATDLSGPCEVGIHTSPDGKWAALDVNYGGVDAHSDVMQTVFILDLATGSAEAVPSTGLCSAVVGWRESRLYYASTHLSFDHAHNFRYDLYVRDLEEGGLQDEAVLYSGELENVGGYAMAASAGAAALWTWDAESLGRWIVHRPADVWMLWKLDEAGGPELLRLTSGGRYRQAALSPDGSRLAAAKAVDGSWDLVVVDPVTHDESVVAEGPAAQFAPAWSPDGTAIAFVTAQGRSTRIAVINVTTGQTTVFTVP